MLPRKCEKSQQEFKTLNPTHVPNEQKLKVGKTKLGMGTLEERNNTLVPIVQLSIIKHQHSQDGGSLRKHESFEELPQTLIGNS